MDENAADVSQPSNHDTGASATEASKSTGTLRLAVSKFSSHNLTDSAAALTYYSVLSIFPGMLVLVSALGLLGQSATKPLVSSITKVAPGAASGILSGAMRGLQNSSGSASILAIAGALGALWASSAYVAAFMRASNIVYEVQEGRPLWKTMSIRLAVTIVSGLLLIVSVAIVVFTGEFAGEIGGWLGFTDTAVTVWEIVKWPILVVLVAVIFAILFWASPNAKPGGATGLLLGGLLSVGIWLVASVGFAFYVSNFASYDKTYGALGGVIVFLVWLWVSNLAILCGAQFNAARLQHRAIAAGEIDAQQPFVVMRSAPKDAK